MTAPPPRMRRVLIVAREFPPAGGAPSIRIAKLAKYLGEFGWCAEVLTTPVDHAWHQDPTLLSDVPPETAVHRVPRWLSHVLRPMPVGQHRAPARWAPAGGVKARAAAMLVPDSGVLWSLPAFLRARRIVTRIDVVMTSAPPFSTHLVGLMLSQRIPWAADYRDNWTVNPAAAGTGIRSVANRWLERRVLASADAVTVVSPTAAKELITTFGISAEQVSVAMNGFDPDDLPAAHERAERFMILYAGSIDLRRDPRPLFAALRDLDRARPDVGSDLHLRLVGHIPSWAVQAARDALGSERVTVDGVVSHKEAVRLAAEAAVLLVISSSAEAGSASMTSKLIEYLGVRRPVLMLAPQGPGTRLVHELSAGRTAAVDDVAAIKAQVLALYTEWSRGEERIAHADVLRSLTRRETARAVAAALDRAVQHARGRGIRSSVTHALGAHAKHDAR